MLITETEDEGKILALGAVTQILERLSDDVYDETELSVNLIIKHLINKLWKRSLQASKVNTKLHHPRAKSIHIAVSRLKYLKSNLLGVIFSSWSIGIDIYHDSMAKHSLSKVIKHIIQSRTYIKLAVRWIGIILIL